ncbi:mRNA cap guanine-N7 methyltransferase [Ascosphaera aggregata]|nr:mRNA cap guanine-N7 methyltransferase [Ascosphaera aggregata]
MSYTIETKKRQFHRVLDSISNPASPSSSITDPPIVAPQQSTSSSFFTPKKPRLSILPNTRLPSPTLTSTSTSTESKPNYVPWSRPRFLSRLSTFRRIDRWSPKPALINEVAWAKRGWECVGVQTVRCVNGCGREVVVKLADELDYPENEQGGKGEDEKEGRDDDNGDDDWGIKLMERREILEKLVKEYEKQIVEGHAENCPWRIKGCDGVYSELAYCLMTSSLTKCVDTIQHLPLTKPDIAVSVLKQRYLGLLRIQSKLAGVRSIKTPISDSEMEEIVKFLPDDFTSTASSSSSSNDEKHKENETPAPPNLSNDLNMSALKLALLGWECDPESPSIGLLTCPACFRRLGLWLHTQKQSATTTDGDAEDEAGIRTLDVALEHQEYCPWINTTTQSCDSAGKISNLSKINPPRPGWEVLVQDIRILHRRQLWTEPIRSPQREAGAVKEIEEIQEDDEDVRKQRDREWWSKIRRLRQVLKVKGLQRAAGSPPSAGKTVTVASGASPPPGGQNGNNVKEDGNSNDISNIPASATPSKDQQGQQDTSRPSPASSTGNNAKKRKTSASSPRDEKPAIQALSQHPQPAPRGRKLRQPERLQKKRKRGRTPPAAYSRRDRTPEQDRIAAATAAAGGRDDWRKSGSGSRSRSRSRSPRPSVEQVRPRKRPSGGARIGQANIEAVRRRQEERERARYEELHHRGVGNVQDVVRDHYNSVPERGREWRKTDSRIKGLRAFNNWVKSCVIQKFAPDEDFVAPEPGWHGMPLPPDPQGMNKRLLVADLGCGKGGDLGKWQQCPQPVDLYVGLDPAEVSIQQAKDRYIDMRSRCGSNRGRRPRPIFHAEFYVQDCFGKWLGHIPIIQEVGIDASVGPAGNPMSARWGGGGFDVVTSMFAMHYAFESEQKARQMLHNVAGLLKKGGRFVGVGPNSDVLSGNVVKFHERRKEALAAKAAAAANGDEQEEGEVDEVSPIAEWGNKIYHVRFSGETPEDGIFRPPFGWKYNYFLEEAVEEIPEYVVPWEAFRALTEEYNLELQYRKSFLDVWKEEQNDPILGPLSERMGVRGRDGGPILVSEQELDAAGEFI